MTIGRFASLFCVSTFSPPFLLYVTNAKSIQPVSFKRWHWLSILPIIVFDYPAAQLETALHFYFITHHVAWAENISYWVKRTKSIKSMLHQKINKAPVGCKCLIPSKKVFSDNSLYLDPHLSHHCHRDHLHNCLFLICHRQTSLRAPEAAQAERQDCQSAMLPIAEIKQVFLGRGIPVTWVSEGMEVNLISPHPSFLIL